MLMSSSTAGLPAEQLAPRVTVPMITPIPDLAKAEPEPPEGKGALYVLQVMLLPTNAQGVAVLVGVDIRLVEIVPLELV